MNVNLISNISKNLLIFSLIAITFLSITHGAGQIFAQEESDVLNIPANFTVDLYQNNDIIVLWDEANTEIDSYIIFKGKDPNQLEELVVLTDNETSYIDSDVAVDETYYYQLYVEKLGFISAETEIKEITLVSSNNISINNIDSVPNNQESEMVSGEIASMWNEFLKLFDPENENFIINLVALNIFLIGILSGIYLGLRSIRKSLEKRPTKEERKRNKIKLNTQKRTIKVNMGDPDVDIVENANKNFLKKNKSNLDEWLK
jgi:hypothetical protein